MFSPTFLEEQIVLFRLFLIFSGLDGDWGGSLHLVPTACRVESIGEPYTDPDRVVIKVLNKDGVIACTHFRAGYARGRSGVETWSIRDKPLSFAKCV
jgi:hypothetical protein